MVYFLDKQKKYVSLVDLNYSLTSNLSHLISSWLKGYRVRAFTHGAFQLASSEVNLCDKSFKKAYALVRHGINPSLSC